MSDPYEIILSIQCDQDRSYQDFIDQLMAAGLIQKYELKQHPYPALSLRNYFIDKVVEDGFGSLLNFTIAQEDITSASMTINDVEAVVARFVQQLLPATRLVIVDPYFYSPHPTEDTAAMVQGWLGNHASTLTGVYIVHEHGGSMKQKMHAAIGAAAPGVNIHETRTSAFHDRFWINPDAGTGIVMGTSMSGLGRRVALVDKLGSADVQQLLIELRAINVPV